MSFGPMEIFLLLVIVLVLFGPSRLPGLGKSVGEAIRGFKKGIDGDEIDVTNTAQNRRDNLNPSQEDPVTQSQSQGSKSRSDS